MSAQSVMSFIAPTASTAAGVGVSEDAAADGVLFAALVADASGKPGDATPSAQATPTAPAATDVMAPDADATEAAASAWPPVPVLTPVLPATTVEAPLDETPALAALSGAAPDFSPLPADDAKATPSIAPDASEVPEAPAASSSPTSAPMTAQTARSAPSAETSPPISAQDRAAAPQPAPEAEAKSTASLAQATSSAAAPATPTAVAATLAASQALASLSSLTSQAEAPAEPAPVETPKAAAPSSPAAQGQGQGQAQTQAQTQVQAQSPAPTPPPTPPRMRDPQGRGETRVSNAATAMSGDSASTASPNLVATPSTANNVTTAPGFVVAQGGDPTVLAASVGDAPLSTEGEAAPAALPPLESQTGAPAANRDLGLSMLSRATVETTAQIAAQIIKKLDGRSTRFDMVLTPEGLGSVDVSMDIDSDGRLTARLAFDNPAAATDLRGRADELRRQLQEAGFQLSQDSLEFSERNPSSGFGGGGFDRPPDRRAFTGAARLATDADLVVPTPRAWTSLSLTPDRVDLKV